MWNSLRFHIGVVTLASLAAMTLSLAIAYQGNWLSVGELAWARPLIPIVLSLLVILVLGRSYLMVRQLIAPLRILTQVTKQIGQGDYHAAEKPLGGVIEIEDLRRALDQMAQKVLAHQSALEFYVSRVSQVQEEERLRVARDLHDHKIQSLVVACHAVASLQESTETPEVIARQLDGIRSSLLDMIDSLRQFASDLRPPLIEEWGLVATLQQLARDNHAGFQTSGQERALDGERAVALFRVVQEALRNAAKHSHAKNVRVSVTYLPTAIIVEVHDDGMGFEVPRDYTQFARTKHFGLMSMQEYAQLLHGELVITSDRTKGTRVLIQASLDLEPT